ncbi:hypothetical protein HDU67_004434, partial [Dinochytrium kinnereticum]
MAALPPLNPAMTAWDGVLMSLQTVANLRLIAAQIVLPLPWPATKAPLLTAIMASLSAIVPRPAPDPFTHLVGFPVVFVPPPPPPPPPALAPAIALDGDAAVGVPPVPPPILPLAAVPLGDGVGVGALPLPPLPPNDPPAADSEDDDSESDIADDPPALNAKAARAARIKALLSGFRYASQMARVRQAVESFLLHGPRPSDDPPFLLSRQAFFAELMSLNRQGIIDGVLGPDQLQAWVALQAAAAYTASHDDYLPLSLE